MKWYQPIECDNTVKNPLVCDFDNLEQFGFDANNFKEGRLIDGWNDCIFLQAKKKKNDGNPDDALQNHLMLPIFSLSLIAELNKAAIRGIQYLPIKVLKSNNESVNGFHIANILHSIEALDKQRSDYFLFREDFPNPSVRGKIAGITKYVLQKEKLLGFDIIRLKDYKQRFFVSERFKDVFEKNKFTGYSFKEVELV